MVSLKGSVPGLGLFNIYNSDTDKGIKFTLSKFAGGTELSGAADRAEGRDGSQRDLETL